jgi:hypothetical protein
VQTAFRWDDHVAAYETLFGEVISRAAG